MKKTYIIGIALTLAVIVGGFLMMWTNHEQTKASANDQQVTPQKFEIRADGFSFKPNIIEVQVNVPVELTISSDDYAYNFELPAFDISEKFSPNQSITVRFTPTQKGKFGFECSFRCGTSTYDMEGYIIVK